MAEPLAGDVRGDGNLRHHWLKLLFGDEVKDRSRPNSAVCVRLALVFSLKPLQGSRLLSSTAHQIKHSLAVVYCVSLARQTHTLVTACVREETPSPFMFCRNLLSVLVFSFVRDVQNELQNQLVDGLCERLVNPFVLIILPPFQPQSYTFLSNLCV